MIFATNHKLEAGQIHTPDFFIYDDVRHLGQPFKILRESTKEEYINSCIKEGISPRTSSYFPYYYEAETD